MQAIPEAEEPVLGIPLLGTIVMGVPRNGASRPTPRKKRSRPICAMPDMPVDHQTQQTTSAGPSGGRQPQQAQSGDGPGPDKPKAKPKKKRKAAVPYESPLKLPPISPGALSLREGVKRRRLAKQLEEQAAAEAAAVISQAEDNAHLPCALPKDQSAAHPGPEAATAAEGPVPAKDGRNSGNLSQKLTGSFESATTEAGVHATDASIAVPHSNQQASEHRTQPSAEDRSQPQLQSNASAAGSQGSDHTASQDEQDDSALPCHTAEPAEQGMPACSERLGNQGDQRQQTLSFDVGSMELFQQQDTCDAFGSFWRRTSGVGTATAQDRAQHSQVAPTAFGGDLTLLQWFLEQCLLLPCILHMSSVSPINLDSLCRLLSVCSLQC